MGAQLRWEEWKGGGHVCGLRSVGSGSCCCGIRTPRWTEVGTD